MEEKVVGLFSFLTGGSEKNQILAANAREKAYAMSIDQLIGMVYQESDASLAVKNIYCQELSKKIKDMPDRMLENNFNNFKDKNMNLRIVMGRELVDRGLYENIGGGAFAKKN